MARLKGEWMEGMGGGGILTFLGRPSYLKDEKSRKDFPSTANC